MAVRSRTLSRHAYKRSHEREEPRHPHESRAERFQEHRAEREAEIEEKAHPTPMQRLKGIFRTPHVRPEPEEPSERREHRPAKPFISPKTRRQLGTLREAVGGAARQFKEEAVETGKEILHGKRPSRKTKPLEKGFGEFLGVKGGRPQRINQYGYIEIQTKSGQWIHTGKKAHFKLPKHGVDEATGLEYGTDEEESKEKEGRYDREEAESADRALLGALRSPGRQPRGTRTRRHRDTLQESTFGEEQPFRTPSDIPAWHTGVSGMNLPYREEGEEIVGSGLGLLSSGTFKTTYSSGLHPKPIAQRQPGRAQPGAPARAPVAAPAPAMPAGYEQYPPEQPEQIIGSGLGSLASGQFAMTYGQRRAAPPVAAPAPAVPAGMPAGMSMQAIPPATMRGMPPMQMPVPAPAPTEPAYSAGLGALSSGSFAMSYGAKPEEQPQVKVEAVLKKGKKKKKGKAKQETIVVVPPQPLAQSNSPSFSAFNEVFGDRGLHL